MSSLTDILTATKNVVTAINGAAQTYLNVNGVQSQTKITTATLVKSGQGRIVSVSVIVPGTAAGMVYDAAIATATTAPVCTIPIVAGVFYVNMPVSNGIVIVPGSGQTISISYS